MASPAASSVTEMPGEPISARHRCGALAARKLSLTVDDHGMFIHSLRSQPFARTTICSPL
jgi:hypothetical protein